MKSFLFIVFAIITSAGIFYFSSGENGISFFPSSERRIYPARTVFSPPAAHPDEVISKEFTPLFVDTPSFQKTPMYKFSYPSAPAPLEINRQKTISAILSQPLKPARLSLSGDNWTGDGACYNSAPPNGQNGANISGIQCDGLHIECNTNAECIKTGFCFYNVDTGECEQESCLGVCGFDAFIWDSETLMCGCNTGSLAGDKHAEQRCRDLGGEVVRDGGNTFCRYSGDTCPKSWQRHQKWSQTSAKTCTGTSSCGVSPSCTTGSHAFDNIPQETCEYVASASRTQTSCVNTIATCSAPVGQIGCTSSIKICADDGGEEVKDGDTPFCKFSADACPSGWNPYGNWSQTSARPCAGTSSCGVSPSCTTKSHGWENNDTQETCEYISSGARNGDTCTDTIDICTAPITNVGCY